MLIVVVNVSAWKNVDVEIYRDVIQGPTFRSKERARAKKKRGIKSERGRAFFFFSIVPLIRDRRVRA